MVHGLFQTVSIAALTGYQWFLRLTKIVWFNTSRIARLSKVIKQSIQPRKNHEY